MLGAIVGDIVGSVFEWRPVRSTDFPLFAPESRFTDDTVLTVATAYAILNDVPYDTVYRDFGRRYPDAGYGGAFFDWLFEADPRPYNSWGNGSAMRVSPVGLAFDTAEDVLREAQRSAAVTHNHPEGVKGAQATALAVFLARTGTSREEIRAEIMLRFGYDLRRSLADIRPHYSFDVSCQGSVPEAIVAFLDSEDFEGAIRGAVSLGGDSDTQAAIAGAIAHAFDGHVPEQLASAARQRLPSDLLEVVDAFERAYPVTPRGTFAAAPRVPG
jgi:ADP-ribosylglycohydrolase